MFSISLKIIGLFKPSISYWMSCFFNEVVHSSMLLNLYVQSSLQHFLLLLVSVGSVIISPGSFMILLICVFSFFIFQSSQRFVNLIEVFKEPALCFIDCLYCFSVFQFTVFCSCFHLLLSASGSFGFILLFSRFLRWEILLLIGDFFSFQVYVFIAINFPVSTIVASAQTWGRITEAKLIEWLDMTMNWEAVVKVMGYFVRLPG